MDILTFSKGLTHDFGKNCKFHLSLFLDKMGVEIMCDDDPSRKLALLNYKNINFTKSPNCIFSIRLTHDFRQKLQVSSLFRNFPACLSLDNRGLEIMFDDHLVREQALLGSRHSTSQSVSQSLIHSFSQSVS